VRFVIAVISRVRLVFVNRDAEDGLFSVGGSHGSRRRSIGLRDKGRRSLLWVTPWEST
jgi:hypothetical protein